MPAPEIITFGCRLNAFESEIIRRAAGEAGLGDAVIVNTCAVTAEAERQARQAIRRARREHPAARIIVTGCAATLAPELYATMPEVDQVLDNQAKLRVESYRTLPLTPTPSPQAGRGSLLAGVRGDDACYGVLIPSFFNASSICRGGSILMASASPVSSRLLRLERIAGQP